MKNKALFLIALIVMCVTACTQYIPVWIPGGNDGGDDHETFVPDVESAEELSSKLAEFAESGEKFLSIKVGDGDYVLDKPIVLKEGQSLTIIGESEDTVISLDDSYYKDENRFDIGGTMYFAQFYAPKGTSIHLENATIGGKDIVASEMSSSTELANILAVDSDVYLDNVVINGINMADYFGMQTGFGVWVRGADEENTITITNCNISGFQKGGILIGSYSESSSNNDKVTLTGNTITGIGHTTLTAQNGIQISTASIDNIISVRGNTISDLWYTAPAENPESETSSTGILLCSQPNESAPEEFEALATDLESINTFRNVEEKTSFYINTP